ncbi:MAG: CDP-glucose 4,6-dehydratase [Carboxylicivirga sp.]|jgi:CDP-glucose 4,6-dehydratase|nr:CDP-glucose 4,6-dehydratase [Carboxylicivirga sp.]
MNKHVEGLGNFYAGKTVMVTGHTGFKGSWLCIWLLEMGAKVVGLGLDPYTERDNFVLANLSSKMIDIRGDIRDKALVKQVMDEHEPEIVFHLAAQPLVRLSYDIPVDTYEVNVMGTIHVLEAMRTCDSVKVGVMVTTDKCYENKEHVWGYRENEPMGGHDPYSSSKGATEIAISSWRRSYFNPMECNKHGKAIASVRAGNVIGGGDWAKDRIIPDCIRALEADKAIEIRSPKSVRPWQHVLEPLSGYLLLALKMWKEPSKYCEGWNFGPDSNSIVNVWEVGLGIIQCFDKGKLVDTSNAKNVHEANLLLLDISKAKSVLGWQPVLDFKRTIEYTVNWYKDYKKANVYDLCVHQINEYILE